MRNYHICACCKQRIMTDGLTPITINGVKKWVCPRCVQTKPYSTKNNSVVHKQVKHTKCVGYELECTVNNTGRKVIPTLGFGLIPTYDASLPSNGVEYKTPIMRNLCGVKKMLYAVYKYANFRSSKCGQHINVSDSEFINKENMGRIRFFSYRIFDPLTDYCRAHEDDTKRVWGRWFTDYANANIGYQTHCSWINLSYDNRIEFRLSKLVTPDQYFHLTNMCLEMLDVINTHFLTKYGGDMEANVKAADKTGKYLVKVFQKYATGKANCQRPERNKQKELITPARRARREASTSNT